MLSTPFLATIAGVETSAFVFAAVIILIALFFDYVNGFHDAANSIATIVSTRVLSPGVAVMWAAFFNFIAFIVLGEAVAKTIGSGMIDLNPIGDDTHLKLLVVMTGVLGAVIWNLITWFYGIPSSSSHALVGGYAGAAVAAAGFSTIVASGWIKTILFIFLSPLVGVLLGATIMISVMWIFRNWSAGRVDGFFRKGQLLSAALFSLGHGGNDAQKTMGIIAGVLVYSGIDTTATHDIPFWVVISCQAAIGLGTLGGGWRIVKTMGSKITKLKPVGGFSAETAAALSIIGVTFAGIPVSTTHTITGAIAGVGATRRLSAVRWGVAGTIVWAWILTIPASAVISAVCFWIARVFL